LAQDGTFFARPVKHWLGPAPPNSGCLKLWLCLIARPVHIGSYGSECVDGCEMQYGMG